MIEDAATAFGAKVKNKYVGAYNDSIAVFSFYANKVNEKKNTTGEVIASVITLQIIII